MLQPQITTVPTAAGGIALSGNVAATATQLPLLQTTPQVAAVAGLGNRFSSIPQILSLAQIPTAAAATTLDTKDLSSLPVIAIQLPATTAQT